MMRIAITDVEAGTRLDKLIVQRVPGLGRAGAKRLFAEGRVRLFRHGETYGNVASKGDIGTAGDAIDLDIVESSRGTAAVPDPSIHVAVVLETPLVVVADKPAGQPTAPLDPGELGTLANGLLARYPEMDGVGFSLREPGLCHRLDTGTSGLVLAARTPQAFETLTHALREGRLDKRYLVICAAKDLPELGTINIPLASHPKDRRRVYPCMHPRDVARYAPRPASTTYTKLCERGPWALLEVKAPKAVRHQIRAHFAAIEHPLVGDTLYGGPPMPGPISNPARHALHAHHLVWKGDADVPAFTVASPLPDDLEALLGETTSVADVTTPRPPTATETDVLAP